MHKKDDRFDLEVSSQEKYSFPNEIIDKVVWIQLSYVLFADCSSLQDFEQRVEKVNHAAIKLKTFLLFMGSNHRLYQRSTALRLSTLKPI